MPLFSGRAATFKAAQVAATLDIPTTNPSRCSQWYEGSQSLLRAQIFAALANRTSLPNAEKERISQLIAVAVSTVKEVLGLKTFIIVFEWALAVRTDPNNRISQHWNSCIS